MSGIDNRPGKPALDYRVATYRTFLARMGYRARQTPPLDALNTAAASDFSNALMGAWARVCDVLTFYQERIANEGYLGTAREAESVVHLARLLGVARRPAVGAETRLVAQLIDAKGEPAVVTVSPGGSLTVQNTPPQGELPVVFEASERIALSSAWNAIPLQIPTTTEIPRLWPGDTSLRVSGTATGLRAGSAVLIEAQAADVAVRAFVIVDQVEVDRTTGCTLMVWSEGIAFESASGPVAGPVTVGAVTLLRRTAGLFGNSAADWAQLPASRQNALGVRAGGLLACGPPPQSPPPPDWVAVSSDLPTDAAIRALVATPDGSLLAGTSTGLYRSVDGGASWARAALVPPTADIHALHCAADGLIYAGGARGLLAASTDDGVSWAALPMAVTSASRATMWRRLLVAIGQTPDAEPLPAEWTLASTIRAVVSIPAGPGDAGQIAIGTDQGVYTMTTNSLSWRTFNDGLPRGNDVSGAADVTVHALAWGDEGLTAATSEGLYATPVTLAAWRQVASVPPAYCLARQGGDSGSPLFAGTADGVYQSVDGSWKDVGDTARSAAADLAGRSVTALAAGPGGVVAGTDGGIFWLSPGGGSWQAANQQDLALFSVDPLFADALDKGVVPPDLRAMFTAWGIDLAAAVGVTAQPGTPPSTGWTLVEQPDPPATGRTFRIASGTRFMVSQLLACPQPASALLATGGTMLAATPHGPLLNRTWPDFQIADGQIYLDRSIPDLEPGGVLVLATSGITMVADPAVYPVDGTVTAAHTAFGKQANVTRIDSVADTRLEVFDLRTTAVYLASSPLTAFAPRVASPLPLTGDVLTLAGNFDALGTGRALLVSGPRPAAAVTRMGGVFVIDGTGAPLAAGLANEGVLAMASSGQSLFAATASGFVGRRTGADDWAAAGTGLPKGALVTALAGGPAEDAIVAGTQADGVFRLMALRWPNPKGASQWVRLGNALTGETVNAVAQVAERTVYAATAKGVFRYDGGTWPITPGQVTPGGRDWVSTGLDAAVTLLAAASDGRVYAALDRRIAVLVPGAPEWRDLPPLPSDADVTALAVDGTGGVLAGLGDGRVFFHSEARDAGPAWLLIERLPGGVPVGCLLIANGALYAGSRGAGAFVWRGDGAWRPVPFSVSNDVRALALDSSQQLLAGCDAAVYLSPSDPCVLQSGLLTLLTAAETVPALAQQMVSPALAQGLAAAGATLSAAARVTVVERDRSWLLRDADRVWVVSRSAPGASDEPATVAVRQADLVDVLAGPSGDAGRWTIAAGTAVASVRALPGELVWQAARSSASPISEVAFIAAVDNRGIDRMTVHLTGALRHCYDAAQARVSANLVRATQGETITGEVLGSGNHAQAFQQFGLQRAPLTYSRDADGAGVHGTLWIEVNGSTARALRFGASAATPASGGEHWHHTPSFLHNGPGDRVYMTASDTQGRTTVRFGDGINGARLPSGTENVTASYRYGAGRSGNVAAGTLIALRKRPAGIRSVTNPTAAYGGRDAESIASLRRRVPQQPRHLERIVAFADYVDFARAFPGIGAVEVDRLVADGQPPTLGIWAATDDGLPLTDNPGLLAKLSAAVEGCRSDPVRLHVGGFTPVKFGVAAELTASAEANPATLRSRAGAMLGDSFALGHRAFRAGVSAEGIAALLATLPGVVHAEIVALYTATAAMGRAEHLRPARAAIDPSSGAITPPEALVIDPDGIAITVRQT